CSAQAVSGLAPTIGEEESKRARSRSAGQPGMARRLSRRRRTRMPHGPENLLVPSVETLEHAMEFVRKVDFDRLAATSERVSQTLIGRDSGASSCSVNCIKTPPDEGSPAGLHKHMVDQLFYVL